MQPAPDPFRLARQETGVLQCPIHGENIAMILRHEDVRRAAKDWQTFSSDAPFRVPIPSEEDVRFMRQLPIETNPPEHTDYRRIADPFFQRPKDPEFIARVEALIGGMLTAAMSRESIEVVNEFALPIHSRALTYLLNMPESEADLWIGWRRTDGVSPLNVNSPARSRSLLSWSMEKLTLSGLTPWGGPPWDGPRETGPSVAFPPRAGS